MGKAKGTRGASTNSPALEGAKGKLSNKKKDQSNRVETCSKSSKQPTAAMVSPKQRKTKVPRVGGKTNKTPDTSNSKLKESSERHGTELPLKTRSVREQGKHTSP